jgi:5-methyltetrahydropteroyltriglutamate--homocysteine methyltransferase
MYTARGMSRRHACHKMVSIEQGTNIVRRKLGVPEAACLAADERFSMVEGR